MTKWYDFNAFAFPLPNKSDKSMMGSVYKRSGLNSDSNEIICEIEKHVGNVNCFSSPCCPGPAVLIKCEDIAAYIV